MKKILYAVFASLITAGCTTGSTSSQMISSLTSSSYLSSINSSLISSNSTSALLNSGIAVIVSGEAHSFAMTNDGKVYAWGYNFFGHLGLGSGSTENINIPTLISFNDLQSGEKVQYISSGDFHTLAVTSKSRVFSWGNNLTGSIGDGTTENRNSPTLISFSGLQSGETISNVNAGSNHSLAITTNGRVYAWGANGNGQLGDGTIDQKTTPTLIAFPGLESGETIRSVSAGLNHTLAVTTNGRVYAWGANRYGQLGDGTTNNITSPKPIDFNGLFPTAINSIQETIRTVSAGNSFSLAVTTNGNLFAWGRNDYYQLGGSFGAQRNRPELITIVTLEVGETIQQSISGFRHSFVVTTTGRVFAWGRNDKGQLGNGTTDDRPNPTLISFTDLQAGETIRNVIAGSEYAHAVTTQGRVFAWGSNSSGQLGDGTTDQKTTPTLITFDELDS